MKIFDAHISGSLSVSSSAEISNNLLVSGNLNVLGTINGSVSGSTTNADTASFAPKYSLTSSFNTFTSSYNTGSFTGSFKGDGSNLYNIPASGVTGLELNKIVNGSASASVLSDGTFRVNGDAYIDGTLTAKEIHTSIVTSSVLYESGSTKFGDTVDDTHSFTGSVNIYGNQSISGTLSITGSIIPNGNFLYDLGSETNSFRDLYISTGSIRFHNPDGTEQGRITVDRSSGDISLLKTAGLTNIQKATISQGNINPNFLAAVSASNLFVHNKIVMPPSGTINGINLIAFSSSIATTDGNQNTRLNSIESTSGSLNTFTSSASGRLTSLESASSSIQGDFNSFTSSYNTVSGSINNRLGSLESFSGSYTGSFSGSFKGDGTNLFNIPASGVTGLNLTRIADGAATASISNTNGLRVNSNTEITGTLKLNKVNLGSNNIVDMTLTDGGGKYFINGVKNPRLSFIRGFKYRFYYNNINTHPLLFSLTNDGEHNGGTIYTTGVTTNADPFYIEVEVTDATAATLYYFCDHHVGMGNSITVYSDFLHGQSSIGLINVDTTALATTGSNNFTNIQRTSGSLVVTGSVDITGSITLNGQAIGTGKLDETTFQSYTSSNDSTNSTQNSRLTSIESATSSLNSFTSSIDNTIKNKLNTEAVITGSIQVIITGTTGYSTFSSSISTSIGSLSGSVATTTSGLSSSIGSLSSSVATTTSDLSSSVGSLSSSVATTTSGLSSSIGSLSSSIATTTNALSSSLTSSIGSISASIATTTLGLSSSIGSLSSSVATTTLNLENRVDSIETSTGSLNSFTSSISTTIKDKMNSESVLSGSIQVNLTGTTGYSTFSSSIATTTNNLSSSVAVTTSEITSTITSLSSSVATTTSGISSSIGSLSSSIATTTLGTKNRVDSIEAKTGSYATTGSNIFQGSQTITGSLYVSQDLIVAGSSSIQHISSSIVNISDNIITVNALNPSVRFGGLAVIDSGSSPQVSGSILFDSVNNQWLFVHQNQATVTSSILLMGPETYDNLGNESYITQNRLVKSTGIEHLSDSNITDTGTLVSINSNTEITGTLNVTGNIINPNITAIQSSTGSLNTFTASLLSAIELTGSNLTVRGNLLVKGTTTNVNTSTLDVDNNLINLNGAGAANAGLRVKDTTGVGQLSGSLLWDGTNDYWIAGQLGSEQRLVRETEFNNAVIRIGNVESSTGSLNSFTSSINTTIKSKLNSDGVLSGSVQVNHNATTNYVANEHIDHTTVSITAGSGLTGGGDISATRTINVGAGNGITVNADDIAIDTSSATFTTGVKSKLNADGVISGSSQIDGSQLGSNKTITIGSTSTTLGGTSTSLAGLTSVTSTAFTGSLQGLATSETLSTVTSRGATTSTALTINNSTGGLNLNRPATSNYVGLYYQTAGSSKWFIGLRENLTSNNYICYSETLAADVLTLNQTTGVATFGYNMTAANFSGTHSGTSSGTNTGDETLARVNALAITTVGTITSGVWNGTAIGNAYLANSSFNIGTTSISLGRSSASQTLTGVSIDGNAATVTGGVYTSGDQTIGGVKTFSNKVVFASTVDNRPQFPGGMLGLDTGDGDFDIWGISRDYYPSHATSANAWGLRWYGTDNQFRFVGGGTNRVIMDMDTGDIVSTGIISGSTIYGTWNGSSIGTAYTAAKVTAVNQGTGVSVDTTTGSVTVSIGQAVATSSNVTFARVSTPKIAFERNANAAHGLSWYSFSTYTAWCDYMANGGATSTGPTGNITASTGTYVTSWARRFFVEDASTYGWIFEKGGTTSTTPSVVAELRSSDGLFSTAGAIYSAGSLVKTSANSSYSTSFSSVTSVTVTHNLGTKDVAVFLYDSSDNMFWPSSIVTTSTSVVTVTFASSRSGRVVVVR